MAIYEAPITPHLVRVSDPLMGKKAEFHINLQAGTIKRKNSEWLPLTHEQRFLWWKHHGAITPSLPELCPPRCQMLTDHHVEYLQTCSVPTATGYRVVERFDRKYVVGPYSAGEVIPAIDLNRLFNKLLKLDDQCDLNRIFSKLPATPNPPKQSGE